jgi:Rrf2 family protein
LLCIIKDKKIFLSGDRMLYSQTTKYAVMALIELAGRQGLTPIRDIAEPRRIPACFLAKLIPPLVRAGILSSVRGKNGGVYFERNPSKVSLADVVRVIEGDGYLNQCLFEIEPFPGRPDCPLSDVWAPLRERIIGFLEETTIQFLADKMPTAKEKPSKESPSKEEKDG